MIGTFAAATTYKRPIPSDHIQQPSLVSAFPGCRVLAGCILEGSALDLGQANAPLGIGTVC